MKNLGINTTSVNGVQIGQSKILSICIPIYNRASWLSECLDLLLSEIGHRGIPIYISDNSSTDNTMEVVSKFKKKYPFVYYEKNEANLGYQRNFEKV